MSRVKLEPEHGGDEMTVAELQAMSKDELVEHMLAGAPPCQYQDMEAVIFKDIFALERHPSVVITNRLLDYIPFVDAVPQSKQSCTLSEYKACDQKLWSIHTDEGTRPVSEVDVWPRPPLQGGAEMG